MTVAILGANGFVGSALARRLRENDQPVVLLDLPEFDLTRPQTFSLIPSDTDILVHAAGHVGTAPDDQIIWKVNVESTYYLIRYLNISCRPCLVVYLSSGGVYGMQSEAVTCASPLHPDNLYAASKLLSERMLETMVRWPIVILRLFFPFGPGQKVPRLFPSLIGRIARGETIDINTSLGRPIINPVYIEDLVDQIILTMHDPRKNCYNLGGDTFCSIRRIAELIALHVGTEPKFIVLEKEVGNLMCEPDLPRMSKETFEAQLYRTIDCTRSGEMA